MESITWCTSHHVKENEEESPEGDLYNYNQLFHLEIDTGASLLLVSERTFGDCWPELDISKSDVTLHPYLYSGESIPVMGSVSVRRSGSHTSPASCKGVAFLEEIAT